MKNKDKFATAKTDERDLPARTEKFNKGLEALLKQCELGITGIPQFQRIPSGQFVVGSQIATFSTRGRAASAETKLEGHD